MLRKTWHPCMQPASAVTQGAFFSAASIPLSSVARAFAWCLSVCFCYCAAQTASRCSDIGALVAKHDLTGWQSLVLHLLWEKRKGPASFWAPYIACLPGMEEMTLSHPLLWPQVPMLPHAFRSGVLSYACLFPALDTCSLQQWPLASG